MASDTPSEAGALENPVDTTNPNRPDSRDGAACDTNADCGASSSGPGRTSTLDAGDGGMNVASDAGGDASGPGATCSACDPSAVCSSDPAGSRCVCPPGTQDVNGDGSHCVDSCSLASCASDASCHLENGSARCTCNAGFQGDGLSCTRDPACADLGCAAVASCKGAADTLHCACPEGFQGSGVGAAGCQCAADYASVNAWCVHSRSVNCLDNAPPHAVSTAAAVSITYSDAAGWSTPSACIWSCQTDYANENGECIRVKTVPCLDQAPANATSVAAEVAITYTTAAGWSAPAACAFRCGNEFVRTGDTCVPAPCRRASASLDAYVDPAHGVDDMLHGASAGGCAFRTIGYALVLSTGVIHLATGTHTISQMLDVKTGQQLRCDPGAIIFGQQPIFAGGTEWVASFSGGSSLKNCSILGVSGSGGCLQTAGAVTLEGNTISACGGAAVSAIGSGLTLTGNHISDTAFASVYLQEGGSATMNGNTFSAPDGQFDLVCNAASTIKGTGNSHKGGGSVRCQAACACPPGF